MNGRVKPLIGLGSWQARISVYIENRPAMQEYQLLEGLRPLQKGEIKLISDACGNGWRKVFNVYAKLVFELEAPRWPFQKQANTWQDFRDQFLLQEDAALNLLFSVPSFETASSTIHIVSGRTYGNKLLAELPELAKSTHWLNSEFAISKAYNFIICPYFDYRQLSNSKISQLVELINELGNPK
ncbi:hypothetical protein [Agaribacterium sp. ZY112]|uniref:DUF6942 family protein n=1 Tax=Agaribacterium sp. ZY112 TaxID=3233574 RepID=UPI0035260B29